MNQTSLEQRIIELESKLAFQEHTIQELNDIVTSQQKEISLFNQKLQLLRSQLTQLMPSNIASSSEETPPPHY